MTKATPPPARRTPAAPPVLRTPPEPTGTGRRWVSFDTWADAAGQTAANLPQSLSSGGGSGASPRHVARRPGH